MTNLKTWASVTIHKEDSALDFVRSSPDTNLLAMVAEGRVTIWGEGSCELENYVSKCSCLAFSDDSKILAAGFEDGSIFVYKLPSQLNDKLTVEKVDLTSRAFFLPGGLNAIRCLTFNKDSSLLAYANNFGSVEVLSVTNQSSVYLAFDCHRSRPLLLSFLREFHKSEREEYLLSCSEDGKIILHYPYSFPLKVETLF